MGFDQCLCSPEAQDEVLKPPVEDRKEDNKEKEKVKKTLEEALLKDKEEEEEEEEGKGEMVVKEEEEEQKEVNQGQEASPATDTSCLPESALSEEDVLPASPGSSSRPSSVDGPR